MDLQVTGDQYRTKEGAGKVRQVEEAFGHEYGQPVEQELSEMDGCEVMEEYWKGLPRYQRTRIRQQWQAEGRALLPFMQVKR